MTKDTWEAIAQLWQHGWRGHRLSVRAVFWRLDRLCGTIVVVRFFSKAICVTAICMLIFVVGQIVACDLLHSDDCYISTRSPDQNQDHPSTDSCLCCCSHIAVAHIFVFEAQETIVPAPLAELVYPPIAAPANIEHPPRLS